MDAERATRALVDARRSGRPVPAVPVGDAQTAYAVQHGVARALGWFDGAPRHWKSGGASRDAELTHAALPPSGVWTSPARAGAGPWRLRGIEAEVALRLARDVDTALAATLDHESARGLVDAMCVAIELVESRWTEALEAPALARLADQQSHGALVLGEWTAYEPARDWAAQRLRVTIGTRPAAEFRGTHALADPSFVLPGWLKHATRDGTKVAAGSVVTTGTWCGVLFAQPGDRVDVFFDGLGGASVLL